MPSAIILHIQNMCIKSSLVNFHPFPSVMLHFKAHFPHPQTLRPNTYNSCFETNLTKVGFRNGGNCSTTITNLSHSRYVLAWTQLTTIWSFRLCTTMTFPEMRTFILTWFLMSKTFFRNWRPPMFDFFCHQAMHLLQMFGQQPIGTICNNASVNFTHPFWPNFVHSSSFWAKLGG